MLKVEVERGRCRVEASGRGSEVLTELTLGAAHILRGLSSTGDSLEELIGFFSGGVLRAAMLLDATGEDSPTDDLDALVNAIAKGRK